MTRDDRGFALVGALLITVGVLGAVSGLFTLGTSTNRRAVTEQQRSEAFYAAESGINHALAVLRKGASLKQSSPPAAGKVIPDGPPAISTASGASPYYRVWYYPDPVNVGKYRLVAQGRNGATLRHVAITLSNSRSFTDDPPEHITWPNCSGGLVQKPDSIPSVWNIDQAGVVRVDGSLELKNSALIHISAQGPVTICTNSLVLKNSSQILIDPGSQVTFWVKGDLESRNSSLISMNPSADQPISSDPLDWPHFVVRDKLTIDNSSQQTAAVFFLDPDRSRKGQVTLHNSSVLYGGIWAPTRTVELKKRAQVNGAIIGGTVEDHGALITHSDTLNHLPVPGSTGRISTTWDGVQ